MTTTDHKSRPLDNWNVECTHFEDWWHLFCHDTFQHTWITHTSLEPGHGNGHVLFHQSLGEFLLTNRHTNFQTCTTKMATASHRIEWCRSIQKYSKYVSYILWSAEVIFTHCEILIPKEVWGTGCRCEVQRWKLLPPPQKHLWRSIPDQIHPFHQTNCYSRQTHAKRFLVQHFNSQWKLQEFPQSESYCGIWILQVWACMREQLSHP